MILLLIVISYLKEEEISLLSRINVQIWGEVKEPGMYEISQGSNIAVIISKAKGPTSRANLSKVKLIRVGEGVRVINIEEKLKKGKIEELPILKEGDIIIVEEKRFSKIVSRGKNVFYVIIGLALVICCLKK
jgi:protein involved in polysaccharide export with SLBB domain